MVLCVCVAALALIAWYEPGLNQKHRETKPLTPFRAEQVSEIELSRAGQDVIKLERKSQQWRLVSPIEASASPLRANAIASLAAARTNIWYAKTDVDLATLGLRPPLARVRLNDVTLEFGAIESLRDLRYVLIDDQVALLQDRFFHHLTATASAFVDPALLPTGEQLQRLVVPGLEIIITNGALTWSPDNAFVNRAAATAFLQRWRSAAAMSVRTMNYALDWQKAAELTSDGAGTVKLLMAKVQGKVLLGNAALDLQYELPLAVATGLLDPRVSTP
jgi:hypothetical protein